jgi:carbon storage regulator
MLVLTRKLNEQICIGERGITVTVLEVRGGTVRLGISAPVDVRIERRGAHRAVAAVRPEPASPAATP